MNHQQNLNFMETIWQDRILPTLSEYICIPNKSPFFDPEWRSKGHMHRATQLLANWCKQEGPSDLSVEIIEKEGRTPLIFMELPGQTEETILLYGHLDKQPEMSGWDSDLDPWKAVLKGDKLYGRGGADDGYAAFAAVAALTSLRAQQLPHARCIVLIEACEESGSYDLPFYIEALKDRIQKPDLVICLDSGCGNYEQLWVTTSLRGLIGGTLSIEVLNQGQHSGYASGIVPSCFPILSELLGRVEKASEGKILLKEMYVEIPEGRLNQIQKAAQALNQEIIQAIPFCEGVRALSSDPVELLLNRTWKPALSLVGLNGVPAIKDAGNVTLPKIEVKLSLRLPPTCDANEASQVLKKTLEANPPFGAKVHYEPKDLAGGWNAPAESPWLVEAAKQASQHYFGREALYIGEGGSIPFMGMLGEKFPEAAFLITGVLGPNSNAHGPNEFLHVPTAKKLSACIAEVIALHYEHITRK